MAEAADAISALTTERDDQISRLVEALSVDEGEAPAIAGNSAFVTAPGGPVAGRPNVADEGRSARRAMLEQLRRECGSEEEFDTARMRPSWTETVDTCSSSSSADGLSAAELELIRVENREYFHRLVAENAPKWLTAERILELRKSPYFDVFGTPFFWDFEGRLEAGRRLGGGGQAEICEALFDGRVIEYVLKAFRSGSSLADLRRLWVCEAGRVRRVDTGRSLLYWSGCYVLNGTLLKDGRFAFAMNRYWGDLRKLIDLQIVKDVETHQNPPFPHSMAVRIMREIAYGMMILHSVGILHRDLKAANVLLDDKIPNCCREGDFVQFAEDYCRVHVADFDTPGEVMGTGFWRAPEILQALKSKVRNVHLDASIWTEKVDVYSYAMTCYEILTGCIPFQNRVPNDYDGVIVGERPPLPDYVDPEIQELVRRCWHSDPSMRPTFNEIMEELRVFIEKRKEISRSIPEDERDAEARRWLRLRAFV